MSYISQSSQLLLKIAALEDRAINMNLELAEIKRDVETLKEIEMIEMVKRSNKPGAKYIPMVEAMAKLDLTVELVKYKRLAEAVRGLSLGEDWNNGTHAKIYRPKIINALAEMEPKEREG